MKRPPPSTPEPFSTHSLLWRLWVWTAGVVLLAGILASGVSYLLAWQESNELQDTQLQQIAALVAAGIDAVRQQPQRPQRAADHPADQQHQQRHQCEHGQQAAQGTVAGGVGSQVGALCHGHRSARGVLHEHSPGVAAGLHHGVKPRAESVRQ